MGGGMVAHDHVYLEENKFLSSISLKIYHFVSILVGGGGGEYLFPFF